MLSDLPYNVRRGREDVTSHYDTPTLEGITDAVDLCKMFIRSGALGHLFRSALQVGQWYKILSKVTEKEDIDGDGGEGIVNKAVFNVERVPLHYTGEVGNMVASILRSRPDHLNVWKQAVRVWGEMVVV